MDLKFIKENFIISTYDNNRIMQDVPTTEVSWYHIKNRVNGSLVAIIVFPMDCTGVKFLILFASYSTDERARSNFPMGEENPLHFY